MAKLHRRRLAQSVSVLSIMAACAALPVHAEELVLDTIYVTGEKTVRNQKDTASSVSVITATDLEENRKGKADVGSVVSGTPNVVYGDNVGTPVIRGQDAQGPHNGAVAFFAGTVPRATINIDGHYQSYNEFYFGSTSAWDVQSIEVFRGPQTTAQGANAIAGAIVVNTKDPSFTPEGAWQLETGSYNQRRASLAWSGPLSQDVAARFALDYNSRDTFINYIDPNFVQNDIGQDFKSFTARGKFLWVPRDIDGLEVKLTYQHTGVDRPSQEAAAYPYEDLNSLHASMPSWRQNTNTGILDINYDFYTGWKVLNQTQYSHSSVGRRTGLDHGGDAQINLDNFSNDIRLSYGELADTVSGFMGFYAARSSQDEYLDLAGRYNHRDLNTSLFDDTKTNLGLYGEVNWHPAERWTLTSGLRLQHDRIERSGYSTYSPEVIDYDTTFTALLPKLSLAYEVNKDWTVGAMVSRGYNPGGISLNFSNGEWMQFQDEKTWNYELFTRASLMNERLFLTGNVFYTDYQDGQFNIPVLVDGVYYTYTINAEKAKSYGAEIGVDFQATDTLMLRASTGLLHTELYKVSGNSAYEGNEFPKAPGKTLNLSASWDVTDKFNLGGRVNYVDGYFSDTANNAAYVVDGYTLVDMQATYKLNDRIELYGYVNNIFDERKPMNLQAARGTAVFTSASMTAPRTVGIGIRGTF